MSYFQNSRSGMRGFYLFKWPQIVRRARRHRSNIKFLLALSGQSLLLCKSMKEIKPGTQIREHLTRLLHDSVLQF